MARQFVEYLTAEMLYNAQFWVAEGWFDRLKKRMLAMLDASEEPITRSEVINSLKINATTFELLIKTLLMANEINIEYVSRNKLLISHRYEQND